MSQDSMYKPIFERVLKLILDIKKLPPGAFEADNLREQSSNLIPGLNADQRELLQTLNGLLFNEDPFEKSVRLLLQLAKLDSDSIEADAIRDQMDAPYRYLTEGQIKLLGQLSAALPHK
jgi:hypothetical protein